MAHSDLNITIRPVLPQDYEYLYIQDSDPQTAAMAGFIPRQREAFFAHIERCAANPEIYTRIIELDGRCVGSLAAFPIENQLHIGYTVNRADWGKGIASKGLSLFIPCIPQVNLHASTIASNIGSSKVLARNGFVYLNTTDEPASERYPASRVDHYRRDVI